MSGFSSIKKWPVSFKVVPVTRLCGNTFWAKYLGISTGETASESAQRRKQGMSSLDNAENQRVSKRDLK